MTIPHNLPKTANLASLRVAHRDDLTGSVVLLRPAAVSRRDVTVHLSHFSTVEPTYPSEGQLYAEGSVKVSPEIGNTSSRTYTFDNSGPAGNYAVGGWVYLCLAPGDWSGSATVTITLNGKQVISGTATYSGGSDPSALTPPPDWSAPVLDQGELETKATFANPVGGGYVGVPTAHLYSGANQVTVTLDGTWSSQSPSASPSWWTEFHLFGFEPPTEPELIVESPSTPLCGQPVVILAQGFPAGGTFTWTASGPLSGPTITREDLSDQSRETATFTGTGVGIAQVDITYTVSGQVLTSTQSFTVSHPLRDIMARVTPVPQGEPPDPHQDSDNCGFTLTTPPVLFCIPDADDPDGMQVTFVAQRTGGGSLQGFPGTFTWSVDPLSPHPPGIPDDHFPHDLHGKTTPEVESRLLSDGHDGVYTLKVEHKPPNCPSKEVERTFWYGFSTAQIPMGLTTLGTGNLCGSANTAQFRITFPNPDLQPSQSQIDQIQVTVEEDLDGVVQSVEREGTLVTVKVDTTKPQGARFIIKADGGAFFPALGGARIACISFIRIDPDPGLIFPGETVSFRAQGLSVGRDGVEGTDDDFVVEPSVAVDWKTKNLAKKKGPRLEIARQNSTAIDLQTPDDPLALGGVLKNGLKAESIGSDAAPGGLKAKTDLAVPWIERLEFSDPVPIVEGSHIRKIEVKGVAKDTFAIFPGRKTEKVSGQVVLGDLENLVRVTAFVGPTKPVRLRDAMLKASIHFKSFDADDQEPGPIDDETKEQDNRSDSFDSPDPTDPSKKVKVEIPKEGELVDEAGKQVTQAKVQEMGNDLIASIDLRTSFSPGDNYRVVAAISAKGLVSLQAKQDDWQAGRKRSEQGRVQLVVAGENPRTIPDNTDKRARFPVRTTDVLTVWRIVHVELDAMAPVEDKQRRDSGVLLEGEVESIDVAAGKPVEIVVAKLNAPPPTGSAGQDRDGLKALGEGFFHSINKRGKVEPKGLQMGKPAELILANNMVLLDRIKVFLPEKSTPKVGRVLLRDDDDPDLLGVKELKQSVNAIQRLTPDSFDEKKNVFASAFMILRYDGGGDTDNNQIGDPSESGARAPFKLSANPESSLIKPIWATHANNTDPAFLLGHILLAYQSVTATDGDPNSEATALGLTFTGLNSNFGSAFVWLESARDAALVRFPKKGTKAFSREIGVTLAHEMWHVLTGLPDGAGQGSDTFSSKLGILSDAFGTQTTDKPQPERFETSDRKNLRRVVELYAARRKPIQ